MATSSLLFALLSRSELYETRLEYRVGDDDRPSGNSAAPGLRASTERAPKVKATALIPCRWPFAHGSEDFFTDSQMYFAHV